jgi:hypothetical protein
VRLKTFLIFAFAVFQLSPIRLFLPILKIVWLCSFNGGLEMRSMNIFRNIAGEGRQRLVKHVADSPCDTLVGFEPLALGWEDREDRRRNEITD